MIKDIQHRGMLFSECSLEGEHRADDVFPSHPNGTQVSHNRFLLVYATRSWRGTDDDRSIVAQLRADDYGGPVLHETMLCQSRDDWDPLNDGSRHVLQHGHPVVFGVPAGVQVAGQPAPSAGVFVIKWRRCARRLDPKTGLMAPAIEGTGLHAKSMDVQWTQLRVRDDDTIEILQPVTLLRQVGYEASDACCDHGLTTMNQSFTQAVPVTEDGSEWADTNHFGGGKIAVLRYRFNVAKGLYEWVQTGPPIQGPVGERIFEASLCRYRDDWIVAARCAERQSVAWYRMSDLMDEAPAPILPDQPHNNAPLTVYVCPDGGLRLLGGDFDASPHRNGRDPLYISDIDPDQGFEVTARRVVMDSFQEKIGIPPNQMPRVEMAKLLPHTGGNRQTIVHRVRSKATNDPKKTGRAITPEEKSVCSIYYAHVFYDQDYPAMWPIDATACSPRGVLS